jgi:ATP-dependent Clp protease ATP-binding subunit ClpA
MDNSANDLSDVFTPSGTIDRDLFDTQAIAALKQAVRYARRTQWDSVRSPHLFMGLLAAPDAVIQSWGDHLGADLPRLLDQFADLFRQDQISDEPYLELNREFLSDNVIRLLRESRRRAAEHGRPVRPVDLLISLFTTPNSIVAECFERIHVPADRLTQLAIRAEKECGQA